ncbi:hypothetical protein [Accumulibacter sp.]|uniref:hypothetical protein n=1 Tax=Accumulibacter sp. TaxID=2053492 RepID=UPI001D5EF3E7|nr:hypothetical protein [Accumulibacter sp.]MCB1931418.1 hypothetical protein [Accumulibacter sp.]MCB1967842.1 hypothetical protein [Accumulibacter sp.]MCP5229598.1 hypothetical protein [Accumulibacter sp.]
MGEQAPVRKWSVISLSAMALSMLAASVQAVNLVSNGSFEQSSFTPANSSQFTTQVTDWDNADPFGRVYLFFPNTATTSGAVYTASNPFYTLVLNQVGEPSCDGGNFVGIDSDPTFQTPITQMIGGLQAGQKYTLSFCWALSQERNVLGPTTDQWQVTLGSETQSTAVVANPSQGFTGWFAESFTYTPAVGGNQLLSFLAVGSPAGIPPFALLDGVRLEKVLAEPGSYVLVAVALLGLLLAHKRRSERA